MSKSAYGLKVTGLGDLQKAVATLGPAGERELYAVMGSASKLIVAAARPLVPERTGRARGSLKVVPSNKKIAIQAGGDVAPYFGWLDFGGRVGRKKHTWRTRTDGGRYVYPTYHRHVDDIDKLMQAAIKRITAAAGLEMTE